MPQRLNSGPDVVTAEVAMSHTHTPGSTPLNQLPQAATYSTHNKYKRRTSMLPAAFEPAIPASERPQTRPSGHRRRCCVIVTIDNVVNL